MEPAPALGTDLLLLSSSNQPQSFSRSQE